jgi:hypothetical protein
VRKSSGLPLSDRADLWLLLSNSWRFFVIEFVGGMGVVCGPPNYIRGVQVEVSSSCSLDYSPDCRGHLESSST